MPFSEWKPDLLVTDNRESDIGQIFGPGSNSAVFDVQRSQSIAVN